MPHYHHNAMRCNEMVDNVQNMAKRRRSTPTYYHQWKKCLPSKEYLLLLPRRLSLLLCREIWRYCKCVVSPIGLGSVIGHRQYHRFCACPNTKFICLSNLLSTSNVLFLQPMYSHHHLPPSFELFATLHPYLPRALISTCLRVLH